MERCEHACCQPLCSVGLSFHCNLPWPLPRLLKARGLSFAAAHEQALLVAWKPNRGRRGLLAVECSEECKALGHKRRLAERLKASEWVPRSFMRPEEVEPLEKSVVYCLGSLFLAI